jgi:peptidoglycan-N-acetylglucosamine deacetylase
MSQILLTIDVEDWFQVENFKQHIPFSSWTNYELRVEKNINSLLDLFDSIEFDPGRQPPVISYQLKKATDTTINHVGQAYGHGHYKKVRCTFFVLGWIAERLPKLIREIQSRGHEVASHGYSHNLCYDCGHDELQKDLSDSKKRLEDILGSPVSGYRAPSFSINNDVLKIIRECGYLYDSSYNSFGLHSRYGKLDTSCNKKEGVAIKIPKAERSDNLSTGSSDSSAPGYFFELPISNWDIKSLLSLKGSAIRPGQRPDGFVLPWGGGGYFRLMPFYLFRKGVESMLKKDGAYIFYMHPWEIDPDQPRVNEASAYFRFRHYINLKGCRSKLYRLITSFLNSHFITCRQYIDDIS